MPHQLREVSQSKADTSPVAKELIDIEKMKLRIEALDARVRNLERMVYIGGVLGIGGSLLTYFAWHFFEALKR